MLLSNFCTSKGSHAFTMSNPSILHVLWTLVVFINHVVCNYRSVSVNNVDVCRGRSKSLGKNRNIKVSIFIRWPIKEGGGPWVVLWLFTNFYLRHSAQYKNNTIKAVFCFEYIPSVLTVITTAYAANQSYVKLALEI